MWLNTSHKGKEGIESLSHFHKPRVMMEFMPLGVAPRVRIKRLFQV